MSHLDITRSVDDWEWIGTEMDARRTGLALHYPLLYSAVIGLEAERVLEFGMGVSTRVLWAALERTGGELWTCAPDEPLLGLGAPGFHHLRMLAAEARPALSVLGPFDLALHDGSHAWYEVCADLRAVRDRMKRGGLILVHDSQHSYVGDQVERGIRLGMSGFRHARATLPYGFGLTIIRCEDASLAERVRNTVPKPKSEHYTDVHGIDT